MKHIQKKLGKISDAKIKLDIIIQLCSAENASFNVTWENYESDNPG
jgi:hypothetical protein